MFTNKYYGKKNNDAIEPYLTYKQLERRKKAKRDAELRANVSRAGRTDAEKERERILLSNPTNRTSYTFVSPQTGEEQEFHGVEFTEFTAWPNQRIIHGVITITQYDDRGLKSGEKEEDIYVYQPRFEGRQDFVLGPRYKSDGTMNNNTQYAFKNPETGRIFVGSIPKREILSNRQFDFDTSNMTIFNSVCNKVLEENNKQLKNIVSIKYDKDPQTGFIKSVDLTNQEEKAKLDAYVRKYSTPAKANAMLDTLVQDIKREVVKAEKIESAMEEAVQRVGMAKNMQAREQDRQANTQQQPTSLADENARLINNMLKYGIRPSYASPMQGGGGMPPHGGPGMPPPPGGPHHHHGPQGEGGGRRR